MDHPLAATRVGILTLPSLYKMVIYNNLFKLICGYQYIQWLQIQGKIGQESTI